MPRCSYNCCTNACDNGSPARFTTRTLLGKHPSRTNSAIAEGTVLIKLSSTPVPLTHSAFANCNASCATITAPPTLSGRNISNTDRSKQIDVEASTAARSSAPNTCCAHCNNATVLRCSIATPFGCPVDPDVKITYPSD